MSNAQRHHRLTFAEVCAFVKKTAAIAALSGVLGGMLPPVEIFSIPKAIAAAGINKTIHYQGKVSAIGGSAIANGAYNMRFKIFDAATSGTQLWAETWSNGTQRVTMTGGLFSVALGTHVTMTGSVNFNTDSLYLQIEFDPGNDGTYEETFSPRRRFSSVPYAHNANTLDGVDSTQFVRKDQAEVMSGTLTIKPNNASKVGLDILSTAATAGTGGLRISTQGANHIVFGSGGGLYDVNLYRLRANVLKTDDSFYVTGTLSGSVIKADTLITSSGSVNIEGNLTGATINGFGLPAGGCSASNSKLIWNAGTGKFSCASELNGGAGTTGFTGAVIAVSDSRYVNIAGDTMTGVLNIAVTGGTNTTIGLNVLNTISGSVIRAQKTLASSGTLVWEGAASGATLYVASSLQGAGLVDCDIAGTSKLLWDSTTGRFSCGTDQNTTAWSNTGSLQNRFDGRYVNVSGDTMTGALSINVTGGQIGTIGLRVMSTLSGAHLHAESGLSSSGFLLVNGVATLRGSVVSVGSAITDRLVVNAGIFSNLTPWRTNQYSLGTNTLRWSSLYLSGSLISSGSVVLDGNLSGTTISGFGLPNGGCNASTQKLLWNVSTGKFECGTDLTGTAGASTGSLQTYFDNRYVNTSGDSMTGALTINVTGGNNTTIGLRVINALSGSYIHAEKSLTSSGTLTWEGAASGASLYVATSIRGSGLTDCDASTQKLQWDTTTGRFSCATDLTGGGGTSTGALQNYLDNRYVNTSGDTMTGALTINITGGNNSTVGLNVLNTISGSVIRAQKTLASSGTLVWEGAASGASLWVSAFDGAGLTDCDAASQVLKWDTTTKRFSCGTVTTNSFGSGNVVALGDARYVRKAGDTMTGALAINVTGGTNGTLGLNVLNTISGAYINAMKGITTSGSLVAENDIILGSAASVIYQGSNTLLHTAPDGSSTFLGLRSGNLSVTGDSNVGMGALSLFNLSSGSQNVAIGKEAGRNLNTGNGNVFIGYQAGYNEGGSNKLYIDNSSTALPLIYGDFLSNLLLINGLLEISGTTSGSVIRAQDTLASSGTLVWEGAASGASLWVSTFEGAGLTDCDAAGQTVNWDATTKRFTCGTDESAGAGLDQNTGDARYVRKAGDTMTGALIISVMGGTHNTIGLNVLNTMSGAIINASKLLRSSGALVVESGAYIDGSTFTVNAGNNRVGIGTSTPATALEIASGSLSAGATQLRITNDKAFPASNVEAGLEFYTAAASTSTEKAGRIYTVYDGGSSYFDARLTFQTVLAGPTYVDTMSLQNKRVGIGTTRPKTSLDVAGTISGSALTINGTMSGQRLKVVSIAAFSGAVILENNLTGATISGFGLPNGGCNASTQKLLWNVSTGKFECGTDLTGTAGASTGSLQTYFDNRYVNTSGDTMTGALTINVTGGNNGTIGLKVLNTLSGSYIHAEKSLSTSGTLVWEGAASGASLYLGTSLEGAGLTDCDTAGSSKLLWDATTKRFSCGTDQTGGGSGGAWSNTGSLQTYFDPRYVNVAGDTMTGALVILKRSGTGTGNTLVVDTKGLVYDASNKRVGIGTSAPNATLEVAATAPEIRLQTTGSGAYSRVVRTQTTNALTFYNQVSTSSYALTFDGSNDVIDSVNTGPASLPISFAMWVKPTSATPTGLWDTAPSSSNVLRQWGSGNAEWWDTNPSVALGLSANVWQHIVVQYEFTNSARVIKVFRNGAYAAMGTGSNSNSFTWNDLRLGTINGGNWYSGLMDDVRVYNDILTPTEISQLYNGGSGTSNSVGDNLFLWYPLDEGAGTTIVDASGNGRDATTSGSPTWTTGVLPAVSSEIAIISSENDSATVGGLQKFGSTNGTTRLQGNSLQFYTNTIERMRLSSGGLLGLGTTTPGSKLSVSGAVIIGTGIGSSAADAGLALEIIGTASGRVLKAANTLASSGTLVWEGVASGGILSVSRSASFAGSGLILTHSGFTIWNNNSRNVDFRMKSVGDASLFYLDASFNGIGIGTATPKAKLDVQGTLSGGILSVSRSAAFAGSGLILSHSGTFIWNENSRALDLRLEGDTNDALFFLDGSTDRIGIGSRTPKAMFDVYGTMSGRALIINGTMSGRNLVIMGSGSAARPLLASWPGMGGIGIGTSIPRAKLDVASGSSLISAGGTPVTLGGLDPAIGVNDIAVQGKYTYLALDSVAGNDFRIVDNSLPTAPVTLSGADFGGNVRAVAVAGKYAYVGLASNFSHPEILVYDVSNPSSIVRLGGVELARNILDMQVVNGLLYVTMANDFSTGEFAIYDVSNPFSPRRLWIMPSAVGTDLNTVHVNGRYAYLGYASATGNDFRIYDISNPSAPLLRGGIDLSTGVRSIYVSNKYAYLGLDANGSTEFRAYDVSNPLATPVLVGGIETNANVTSIQMGNRNAYLGLGSIAGADFRIVDINTPSAPIALGGVDVSIGVNAVAVAGKTAYIGLATAAGNDYRVFDLNGFDAPAAVIGVLSTNNLSVFENASVGNNLTVGNSLTVGLGGIYSQGTINIITGSGGNSMTGMIIRSRGKSGALLALDSYTNTGAKAPHIAFGYRGNFDTYISRSGTGIVVKAETTNTSVNLFRVMSNVTNVNNTRFRVQNDGNAFADGTFTGGGADYAEYFYTSTKDLVQGELVCIDVTKANTVKRCASAADTNVMGIVSSPQQAAFIGNKFKELDGLPVPGTVLVGLIGQLSTKAMVEGSGGTIRPGDELTPASKPGYARKAVVGEPTVGVALSGLSKGEGMIDVLIARKNGSLSASAVSDRVLETVKSLKIEDEMKLSLQKTIDELTEAGSFTEPVAIEVEKQLQALRIEDINAKLNTLSAQLLTLSGAMAQNGSSASSASSASSVQAPASSTFEGTVSSLHVSDLLTVSGSLVALGDITGDSLAVNGMLTAGGDARIGGDLHIEGALVARTIFAPGGVTIDGDLALNGALTFGSGASMAIGDLLVEDALRVVGDITIEGLAMFLKDVTIKGVLTISNRQAGFAVVKANQTRVIVAFGSGGFVSAPVVTATSNDFVETAWRIRPVTQTGFVLEFAQPLAHDVTFSWLAMLTDGAQTHLMDENGLPITLSGGSLQGQGIAFPVDSLGVPVSSNPLWNACVRNQTPLDAAGQPYNCNRYHESTTWTHPELMVIFTWNTSVTPPLLKLPQGYYVQVTGEAVVQQSAPASSAASSTSSVSTSASSESSVSSQTSSEASQASSEASSISSEQAVSSVSSEDVSSATSSEAIVNPEPQPETPSEPAPQEPAGSEPTNGDEPTA